MIALALRSNGVKEQEDFSVGEIEMRIFQQAVEKHDEFAHDGGEGDERLFPSGAQPVVKAAQDRVVADAT